MLREIHLEQIIKGLKLRGKKMELKRGDWDKKIKRDDLASFLLKKLSEECSLPRLISYFRSVPVIPTVSPQTIIKNTVYSELFNLQYWAERFPAC